MILLTTVCLALSACHPASAPSSGSKTSVSEASGSKQEESKDLAADESLSRELYAMDTVMNLTAYGSNASAALEASVSEINRLDSLLSISSEKGEIYRINADKEGTVSEDVNALLSRSLELSQMTDGLFDCTIEPVMEAWGFTTQNFRIPSEEELEELLSHVDYKQVDLENSAVTIPEDVRLDLGGIAKGFTSSRVMDIFRKNGVTSGIISLGGNVQALGHKPDGNMWRVGIQDPHDLNSTFAVVEVADQAVITSGGYQRYFEENGQTYHHIIDPRTGYPAENGLISVTIISADGTLADALKDADIFIGVSAPNIVTPEMVASMNMDAIIFAMANPEPEIMPDVAKAAGARVVGTGRSDFPNQINNVVAFPGIFKGALEGRARQITEEMKLAAALAIAGLVPEEELNEDNIMPEAFNPAVAEAVSQAVKDHIPA